MIRIKIGFTAVFYFLLSILINNLLYYRISLVINSFYGLDKCQNQPGFTVYPGKSVCGDIYEGYVLHLSIPHISQLSGASMGKV